MRLVIKNVSPTVVDAFGPFSDYHFSRGLIFTIGSKRASLKGGPELEKLYDLPNKDESASPNCPPNCSSLIDRIEQEIGIRLIAIAAKSPLKEPLQGASRLGTVFRLDDYCISADYLAEALLVKF